MINEYSKLVDNVFNQPPNIVWQLTEELIKKKYFDIITIESKGKQIAGVMVLKLSCGIYGLSNFVVDKQYQNVGVGSALLKKVEEKYKGLFILKTKRAKYFYEKHGYSITKEENNKFYMSKLTETKVIDFWG